MMTIRRIVDDFCDTPRAFACMALAGLLMVVPLAAHAQLTNAQETTQWLLQTGGVSHHFVQTGASDKQWSQNHPGIGFEYRTDVRSKWGRRLAIGLMRDSRDYAGGYAGAAYMRQFNVNGDFNAALGLGAFAFYRSSSWNGERTIVPAILPTLSLGLFKNRLSVNVMAIPKVSAFGRKTTPLVFAQFLFRYN